MYKFNVENKLHKILKKLSKKDKNLYNQIWRKIEEIVNSFNIENYKNLRHNLKNFKRVHIGHFVLVFRLDKEENKISFCDFEHHDNIYRRE